MTYYKLYLSKGEPLILDEDDLTKFRQNVGGKSFIQVKSGIVNPSFVVAIYPMEEREVAELVPSTSKVQGYIDEETGKYVVTKETSPLRSLLVDKFAVRK